MPRMINSHGPRVPVAHPGDAITFKLNGACVQATLLKSTETHLVVIVDNSAGSCQQWEIGREEEWVVGWYNSTSRITTTITQLMRSSQLAVVQQVCPPRVTDHLV